MKRNRNSDQTLSKAHILLKDSLKGFLPRRPTTAGRQAEVDNLLSIAHGLDAQYVFGDSTVDCGSGTESIAPPYGVDSDGFSGRYTNGRTVADEIAMFLNLTSTLPYWVVDFKQYAFNPAGYGYASGPAGILPTTGSNSNYTISMTRQIELFGHAVKEHLPHRFGNSTHRISQHLANSIFAISIGARDFLDNFVYGAASKHNHEASQSIRDEFSNLLMTQLRTYIQDLYELGARYMIVFEIGPVGCYPVVRQKLGESEECSEELNSMIAVFNGKLYYELVALASKLPGTRFIIAKTFRVIYDMAENPFKYDLTNARDPCCEVNETGIYCVSFAEPCPRRDQYLFWDDIHLVGKANKLIASKCVTDSSVCLPITFEDLDGQLTMIVLSGQPEKNYLNNVLCLFLLFVHLILVTNLLYFPY
ncbi:hypothetical protein Ahy_B09g097905 [Arachis hypogaea]|uniref:GDSL esterase/lipase n=1 Tax=Arachis hypogaea TaxID=3818 RepID=A0A444XQP1_ARAHY|nr:hypothetical protein Ahy_B09g097905 [Arachis hypogaea]